MQTRPAFRLLVPLLAATLLTACGGGGGGSGGDSPEAFSGAFLLGFPDLVATNGTTTVEAVRLDFATPSSSLPAAGFGLSMPPGAGEVHRLEFEFSRGLDVRSVFPGFELTGPTGTEFIASGTSQLDALRLVRVQGGGLPDLPVRLLIDRLGSVDGSNVLDGDETPTTLRLYVEDPANPGQLGALPAGQYRLMLRGPAEGTAGGLRTIDGEPFCLVVRLGECINAVDVNYSFSVGPDLQALEASPSPTVPVTGSVNVGLDQEYVLRFREALDFQSFVGAANISTLEPFVSTVLPLNDAQAIAAGGMQVTAGANVVLTFNSGDPQRLLPPNYGFVMYMPDPFHDPTQVRVRVVDNATLQGVENPVASAANPAPVAFPVTTQNYGLDPDVYEGAGLVAPTNNLGNALALPPALPLPGSTAGTAAQLVIDVLGSGNAAASDTSPAAALDGVVGVTDRDRNGLINDMNFVFGLRVSGPDRNFPVGVDLTVAVNGNTLSAVSGGRNDSVGDATGTLIGQPIPVPDPLDDPELLSSPLDVAIGPSILPTNNGLAPRQGPGIDAANILMGIDPAIPQPQGGPSPNAMATGGGYAGVPYNTPHGDFLYVIDGSQRALKIFNSNTMQQIGSIPGVASPGGLAIDPGFNFMYVSNTDQGTVQRIDLQPASPNFHTVNGVTSVGLLPGDIAVQPGNQDVLVINKGEDSFSRITVGTFQERARFATGVDPQQIWVTTRFNCMGCTGAFQAYISNGLSNQVTVYESDSAVPQVFNSNGIDGKIWQTISGFQNPTKGIWDQSPVGFWVVNNDGSSADHYAMTNFNLGPMPGFQGPPPFRTFTLTGALAVPADFGRPTDITFAVTNFNFATGAPGIAYVATTSGNVAVYSVAQSTLLGSVQTAATDLYSLLDQ